MKSIAEARWIVLKSGVFVFYGNGGEFGGDAFERWYADLAGKRVTHYLGGTGPNFGISGDVRNRGRAPFLEKKIPFATVTDSRLVRGFVTAGAWFGLNINAFSWADTAQACAWLRLPPSVASVAQSKLFEMRSEVEGLLRSARTNGFEEKTG